MMVRYTRHTERETQKQECSLQIHGAANCQTPCSETDISHYAHMIQAVMIIGPYHSQARGVVLGCVSWMREVSNSIQSFVDLFILRVCFAGKYICTPCVCLVTLRGQKSLSASLELGLCRVASCHVGFWETLVLCLCQVPKNLRTKG